MTISKAVISGIVVRDAEKRFSNSGLAVTNFTLNIDEQNETLLRVIAIGNLAELAEQQMKKGKKVIVEGRLQTNSFKNDNGEDKKIYELQASAFDVFDGVSNLSFTSTDTSSIEFAQEEEPDELIGTDEIPF
jgi:single-strand DNA-binding protein